MMRWRRAGGNNNHTAAEIRNETETTTKLKHNKRLQIKFIYSSPWLRGAVSTGADAS